MTVSRASSGYNPWRMLPTGCGKRWAESESHDCKIAPPGGTIHRHPTLPSRDPDGWNDIFRSLSHGSRPTFSVVYYTITIRAFLTPEPRGTERIRLGHALHIGSVTLVDQRTTSTPLSVSHPPITFPVPPSTYLPPPTSLHPALATSRPPTSTPAQVFQRSGSFGPSSHPSCSQDLIPGSQLDIPHILIIYPSVHSRLIPSPLQSRHDRFIYFSDSLHVAERSSRISAGPTSSSSPT